MSDKIVLIVGYYGFGLLGDEAILQGMLRDLRRLSPDTHFIVTSQSPEETEATYGVKAIPVCDMKAVIDVIDSVDLVIIGGGGVFNEYAPWHSEGLLTLHPDFNVFCASLPLIAAAWGKPCMIYAVGVEPLYSEAAKKQVADAFATATCATVRDQGSLDILKSIGVSVENVRITADPAFRLPNAKLPVGELLERQKVQVARPLLGVQLRHWNPDRWNLSVDPNPWEIEVAKALDVFIETTGATVLFIPFQQLGTWPFSNDEHVLRRVMEMMKHGSKTYLLESLSPSEVSSILGGCDVVLAMRFHSVVLSLKNATPCVAIAYSFKVRTAMERVKMGEFCLGLERLTAEDISTKLQICYSEQDKIRNKLRTVSKEMEQRALKNAEIAVELLKGQSDRCTPSRRFFELAPSLVARQTKLLLQSESKVEILYKELRRLARRLIEEKKEYSFAEELLSTLLGIKLNNPELTYLLALSMHLQGKDPEKALAYYTSALLRGFEEFWVRFNRGNLYLELGYLEEARADLARAVALNPDHHGARERLEEVMKCISEPQLAEPRAETLDLQAELAGKDYAPNVYGNRIPWEIPVQLCIKDFIKAGDCALDIGANIGGVTIAISRMVGSAGQVHAFEPNPFILPRLISDLRANGAYNVVIVPKAAYSTSGEYLHFYSNDSYYSAASTLIKKEGWKKVVVETITLDDYCFQKGLKPSVIKIDAEGADFHVLVGAEQILRRYAPVIIFEYFASVPEAEDPLRFLQRHNYRCYDVNLYCEVDRDFYRLSSVRACGRANILAIPSALVPSSGYQTITFIPYKAVVVVLGQLKTEPIHLDRPGRYVVQIDFNGQESGIAGLRVETTEGEELAYNESNVSYLKHHRCSNLIFEIDSPTDIVAEVVPKGCKGVVLKSVKVLRIEKGSKKYRKIRRLLDFIVLKPGG